MRWIVGRAWASSGTEGRRATTRLIIAFALIRNQGRRSISLASQTHFCRKWVRLARLAEHVHVVWSLCSEVVLCGHMPFNGPLNSSTSSMPCSIFCPALTQSVFSLFYALCSITFVSTLPFLLHCLWGLSHVTLRTRWFHINDPVAKLWEHDSVSSLDSHWKHGCETAKKYMCVFKFFMMRLLLNVAIYSTTYEYIHTSYIHTYTACIQHSLNHYLNHHCHSWWVSEYHAPLRLHSTQTQTQE